jgi:hypothetical protein
MIIANNEFKDKKIGTSFGDGQVGGYGRVPGDA